MSKLHKPKFLAWLEGSSVPAVAKRLGVQQATVYAWRSYARHGPRATHGRRPNGPHCLAIILSANKTLSLGDLV
jgi:transposase-like protein